MITQKNKLLSKFMIFIDLFITVLSFIIAYEIRQNYFTDNLENLRSLKEYIWILWIIVPVWYIVFTSAGVYDNKQGLRVFSSLKILFRAFFISAAVTASSIYITKEEDFSRSFFLIFLAIDVLFISIFKTFTINIRILRQKYKLSGINTIVVGTPQEAKKFFNKVRLKEEINFNVIGYVEIGSKHFKDGKILGKIEDLEKIITQNIVDEVVFTLPKDYIHEIEKYILICEKFGISTRMPIDIYDLNMSKTEISYVAGIPTLTFRTVRLSEFDIFLKRMMDIFGALLGLVITFLISLIVIPLIKLDSKGPVFFVQKRVGLNGRVFNCYKFRSMYKDAEEQRQRLAHLNELKGSVFKIKDDPRITLVGKFIRKLSIDELPQFFNVLIGDMSLVGTRPPTLQEVESYKNHHYRRLSIKPGLTGMWQISGRNNIKNFEKIVKLDVEYIDNWSIFLDIKIILKTVRVVLLREGAE